MNLANHLDNLVNVLKTFVQDEPNADNKQLGQGVYVTDADVARAFVDLAWTSRQADATDGDSDRIGRLTDALDLSRLEQLALITALAPEVDRAFGTIYAYLNDDVGLRRATVSMVQRLAGLSPVDPASFGVLGTDGRLNRFGLVVPESDDAITVPRRQLRVPERVTGHLLGDDDPGARLRECALVTTAVMSPEAVEAAKTLVESRPPLTYVRETEPGTALEPGAPATDDAGVVEAVGGTVRVVQGDARNIKLTRAEDVALLEAAIADLVESL